MKIYKSKEAQNKLQEILDSFESNTYKNTERCMGIYFDFKSKKWVGFDNTGLHCWVEEFTSLFPCRQWLGLDETEEVSK